MTLRIKLIFLLMIFLCCAAHLSAGQKTSQQRNRVQFRLAETEPAAGLTEATTKDKGEKIYLHKEIVATGADIQEARIVESTLTGEFNISIQFTEDGARKIGEATASHIGKPLAILIDGQVVLAARIMEIVKEKSQISGRFTKQGAESIVDAIKNK